MLPNLSDRITVNFSTTNLIIVGGIVLVIFAFLILYIVRLNKRVTLLTPSYGFGGKKIIAVALVAFLAGVLPFTSMLISRSTEIRRQAKEVHEVEISTQIIEQIESGTVVGFSVVPFENGIAWYQDNYEALWEVDGPSGFTFLEQMLSKHGPSYFLKTLIAGEYTVTVHVTAENFDVQNTIEIVIE